MLQQSMFGKVAVMRTHLYKERKQPVLRSSPQAFSLRFCLPGLMRKSLQREVAPLADGL